MNFPHLPVTSLLDVGANFETLRSHGTEGLEIPVHDLGDCTTNMEQIEQSLGVKLPHVPVLSLEDCTRNFEALNG